MKKYETKPKTVVIEEDKNGLYIMTGWRIFRPKFPKAYLDAGFSAQTKYSAGDRVAAHATQETPLLSLDNGKETWFSEKVFDFLE